MTFRPARWLAALTLAPLLTACAKPGDAPKPQDQSTAAQHQATTPGHQPDATQHQPGATHGGPHWTYEGETGPANWAAMDTAWSPCGSGTHQSPIDIDATVKANLPGLDSTQFAPASLRIVHHEHIADGINNGHTIQVNYTGADTLIIGNERYALVQYHFHAPSEHTVRGRRYPMEMHLVHKSDAGRLAVVGVFIESGAHNPAFDPIWSNLPDSTGVETHLEHVKVDVDALLPSSRTSYRYDGSLTTPPCSEGVKWFVLAAPIQLDPPQIEAFRDLIPPNARPVQPLNGRLVVTDTVAETP